MQTVEYTETDADIELEGIACLQVHAGAPAEIRYRNIEIKPLVGGATSERVTSLVMQGRTLR